MATVDERMTVLETRFDTELKHLANKADLKGIETRIQEVETRLMVRLGGLMIAGFGVVIAVLKLWV